MGKAMMPKVLCAIRLLARVGVVVLAPLVVAACSPLLAAPVAARAAPPAALPPGAPEVYRLRPGDRLRGDAIEPFLSRSWVDDSRVLEEAPSVVGFPRERLLAATGDRIFVRQIREAQALRYDILRPAEALRDPVTQDVLGYPAHFVAEARLERAGDPAVLLVTNAIMPVRKGDRVRPARDERAIHSLLLRSAPAGLKGHIISVLNGVSRIGQYESVVLDRGTRDGVEVGQVFAVYDGGEVRDGGAYSVPDSQAGVVMVFRVFERVSFALVMRAKQALHIGERVAAPYGH